VTSVLSRPMVKRIGSRSGIVLLLFIVAACATAAPVMREDTFVPENWKVLAVLPFTGNTVFGKPAGEFFAFQLQKQTRFRVIAPAAVELTLNRAGVRLPDGNVTVERSQTLARLVPADAVFVGSVTLRPFLGAVANVTLIDVATGRVVATAVQDSAGAANYRVDVHARVTVAVERVGARLKTVLEEWSKKPLGANFQ